MHITIEALRNSIAFCKWGLRKKELTEKQRDKYLKAIEKCEKIISEKEKIGEKRRDRRGTKKNKKEIYENSLFRRGY
ncbi:unnamed protein product [marine sediment metagenome]|uniref:Uncharacterized protein n=1 Tax=marine sediment metagenome TaxID=412755 RepID=X1V6G8_9ZZZZ